MEGSGVHSLAVAERWLVFARAPRAFQVLSFTC